MSENFNWMQSISGEIFNKKYKINGEQTDDEVFRGIAKEIARVETTEELRIEWEEKFYEAISTTKLIPAGRILANARPDARMPFYNNCYTISVEDSIESIYNSLKEDALISRTGGGVGLNFSKLRPKDAGLSKGGASSGVISFMKVFNESAKVIQTGGSRRAAHIGILNVDHPEIEDFILAKRGDENKTLTQFNISVGITDKFMRAVNLDEDWDLIFEGKVYKTVKAKYLYELMTMNAFTHNEPGILNLDTINKMNNGAYGFQIFEVNPCFTGDTLIAVADGRKAVKIEDLENTEFPVYSARKKNQGYRQEDDRWKAEIKKSKAFKTGKREVITIVLTDGSSFRCTPDHRLAKADGGYVEAKNSLKTKLSKFYTFSNKNSNKSYRTINSKSSGYSREYRMLWEFENGEYDTSKFQIDHKDNNSKNDLLSNLQLLTIEKHKEKTDRTGENNPINKMSPESKSIYQRHKNVLANAKRYNWDNDRILDAQKKLPPIPEKENLNIDLSYGIFVESIEWTGEIEDVYDLTVEDNNNFYIITNNEDDYRNCSGVLVHNCGEIVMPPYSLCCLSALNLTQFVVNAFTKNAYFDLIEFANYVRIGIRFLDNVLDATEYPLDKILDMSKQWRRIGLGFTGLGNVFSMMRMSYGDEKSKELSDKIGKILRDTSYRESVELAVEKGAFPACDNEELIKSPFIKDLPYVIQSGIREHGLRNVAMNTIAPTGTTSLSIGQNCSSGIEPAFNLSYVRNIRTGKGDATKEEEIDDYAWLKYIEFTGEEHPEKPDFFKTTFDIDVYDAMDIQIIFQKYIDHSISKTLNLPLGTTYEEYKDLFQYAYDNGLKGFTTFNPEGSMKGILEATNKKIDEERETPKRPNELPCEIHEATYKGDKYLLLVGIYENRPYEIFVTHNIDKEFDMMKHKEGKILKGGKGKYSLVIENGDDKIFIKDIIGSFDAVYGTLGRFISMSLRHNVSLQFIVEQLNKDKNFMGFERTVSRVLKKYIKEGEKVKTSHDCPECGNDKLTYQEGCLTCGLCGWSKCS